MAGAADTDDKELRRARFAPYGLLSPGVIWLALFFIWPTIVLAKIALSTKPNPFLPEYVFSWEFSNFTNALSENSTLMVRSFVYAGVATVAAPA